MAEEYPCRCGTTHKGDYALYDYWHCNCFHNSGLILCQDVTAICPDCGKSFEIIQREIF